MPHGDKLPDPASGGHDGASQGRVAADAEGTAGPVNAATRGTVVRSKKGPTPSHPNNVRKLRIERMLSKAELARRANLSVLTIDRVEKGFGCRMNTKRKLLEALGLSLADRVMVFGEEE